MNKPITYLAWVLLCAAASAGTDVPTSAAPAATATTAAPPETPGDWRRVRLEATKLFASATSTVERWPGEADQPALVRVVSTLSTLGRGMKRHGFSTRPPGGVPAHFMEIEPGRKARESTLSPDGAFVLRRFGPPSGRKSGWSGPWTEGTADRLRLEVPEGATCGGPIDGWALVANLACVTRGPEARLFLLTNGGGHAIVARRLGERDTTVSVADLDAPGRRASLSVREVRVELLPAPGGDGVDVFGLDSGVTLRIDRDTGLPLEVEGRRDGIPGIIRFRLTGFGRAPSSRPLVPWPHAATNAMTVP